MQSLARRVLVCGMHVGIEDDALRIGLLNPLSHFLPLLLALRAVVDMLLAEKLAGI